MLFLFFYTILPVQSPSLLFVDIAMADLSRRLFLFSVRYNLECSLWIFLCFALVLLLLFFFIKKITSHILRFVVVAVAVFLFDADIIHERNKS
jgi:hypothetical protein